MERRDETPGAYIQLTRQITVFCESYAPQVGTKAVACYLALLRHIDVGAGRFACWPGQAVLAREMGAGSEARVDEAVKALEGAGLIAVERSKRGGRKAPNHYTLTQIWREYPQIEGNQAEEYPQVGGIQGEEYPQIGGITNPGIPTKRVQNTPKLGVEVRSEVRERYKTPLTPRGPKAEERISMPTNLALTPGMLAAARERGYTDDQARDALAQYRAYYTDRPHVLSTPAEWEGRRWSKSLEVYGTRRPSARPEGHAPLQRPLIPKTEDSPYLAEDAALIPRNQLEGYF